MTVEEFKADLARLSSEQVFRRHLLTGSCDKISDEKVYLLRELISKQFNVDFVDVVIVGSSNLGFSIKPSKRYVGFGDDSDIDVAIVSSTLFENVWKEVFLYSQSGADWPKRAQFFRYHCRGWVRPDKMPNSRIFSFSNFWWDFFKDLHLRENISPYKIKAGLYFSHFFLESYQTISIDQCKLEL